jgi:DNA-binding NtrC family response regulator
MNGSNQNKLPRGEETILLVDDDEITLDIVTDMLSRFGYHIIRANGGEKALDVLKQSGSFIHLVILDMNMPGMSGRDCLEEIKKISSRMKIIISTGDPGTAQVESDNGNVSGFIAKPFRLEEILTQIRKVLGEK